MEKNPENNHLSKNRKCGLKTELSLGLPGSESPERKHNGVTIFGKDFEQNSQTFNTCLNNNTNIKGFKRGFCDAIDECENWVLGMDEGHFGHFTQHGKHAQLLGFDKENEENSGAHAAKAQVVGWPPIRSFRKNIMASTFAKNDENTQGKPVSECLYVKVSMDGAPYLRKVDLQNYTNYKELSLALEKMFSCYISGQCGSHGHGKRKEVEGLSIEYLRASEYVLTYEDKDGDWMLVGDVPWKMFMENCRKLRIMKGSEAIGLAPNADEECKVQASE